MQAKDIPVGTEEFLGLHVVSAISQPSVIAAVTMTSCFMSN